MKFKKIKRFLANEQDVIEIFIHYLNKSTEIKYFRNNEIDILLYSKSEYDDYTVCSVYGYNADGYNAIAIKLRCLEEDK